MAKIYKARRKYPGQYTGGGVVIDPELFSIKEAARAVKDPTTYSVITYVWVAALSAWGGVVRYVNIIRGKRIPLGRVVCDLVVSVATSIFVGVITFYLCEAAGFEPLWTAVCVAVTGHMGAEELALFRNIVSRKLGLSDAPAER